MLSVWTLVMPACKCFCASGLILAVLWWIHLSPAPCTVEGGYQLSAGGVTKGELEDDVWSVAGQIRNRNMCHLNK